MLLVIPKVVYSYSSLFCVCVQCNMYVMAFLCCSTGQSSSTSGRSTRRHLTICYGPELAAGDSRLPEEGPSRAELQGSDSLFLPDTGMTLLPNVSLYQDTEKWLSR